MSDVRRTDAFATWIAGLRDRQVRARIEIRIVRLANGNGGAVKPVGEGVSELLIDYGPGYRVYFVRRGAAMIVLLGGGDKSTQARDTRAARALARELKE